MKIFMCHWISATCKHGAACKQFGVKIQYVSHSFIIFVEVLEVYALGEMSLFFITLYLSSSLSYVPVSAVLRIMEG